MESITDNQILSIQKYFQHYYQSFTTTAYGSIAQYDMQIQIKRKWKNRIIEDFVIVSIEPELDSNQYRIVGVRVMDKKTLNVKRTIFTIPSLSSK